MNTDYDFNFLFCLEYSNFTEGALNWLLEHSDDNSIHRPVSEEELRSLAARNSSLASLLLRGGLAIPEGGEGIEMHVDEEDGQIHLGNMEEEVAPSEFGRHDPLLIHALSNSESEEDEEEEDDEFEDPESEFPDVQLYGNEDSGGDMDTGDDEKDHDDEGEVWGL